MDIKLIPVFIIPSLVLVGITSLAKFAIVFLSSRSQGFSKKTAFQTGISLSSSRGGEMSLIVAKGGIDIGVASPFILPIVGTITIISTFLSPYLIKLGWKLVIDLKKKKKIKSLNHKIKQPRLISFLNNEFKVSQHLIYTLYYEYRKFIIGKRAISIFNI